ncbi:alpha/beta-hydrolase [Hortaea werneckii]|nr:alpha/beta-hydrolase [Hortaea werneckii]
MAIWRTFTSVLLCAFCLFSSYANAFTKSAGCGEPLPAGLKQGGTGSSNRLTITSSGVKRSYLLHLPRVYTPTNAHGLIFSFHGRGKNAKEQEQLSQFSNYNLNPNMLVVYPDGIKNQWQGDPDAKSNDVQLVLDLIEKVQNRYCIDKDRVYAVGKSNGGVFAANVLACHPIAQNKIAAFAGIAGAYYQGSDQNCKPASTHISCAAPRRPVPVLEMHGTADSVIPYKGGPRRSRCLPSIPHFTTAWAERNGLGKTNVTTKLYNAKVTKYEYGKSRKLQGVNTHYKINGLGHQWPSKKANDDGGSTYLDATPIIMDFFRKWEGVGNNRRT